MCIARREQPLAGDQQAPGSIPDMPSSHRTRLPACTANRRADSKSDVQQPGNPRTLSVHGPSTDTDLPTELDPTCRCTPKRLADKRQSCEDGRVCVAAQQVAMLGTRNQKCRTDGPNSGGVLFSEGNNRGNSAVTTLLTLACRIFAQTQATRVDEQIWAINITYTHARVLVLWRTTTPLSLRRALVVVRPVGNASPAHRNGSHDHDQHTVLASYAHPF